MQGSDTESPAPVCTLFVPILGIELLPLKHSLRPQVWSILEARILGSFHRGFSKPLLLSGAQGEGWIKTCALCAPCTPGSGWGHRPVATHAHEESWEQSGSWGGWLCLRGAPADQGQDVVGCPGNPATSSAGGATMPSPSAGSEGQSQPQAALNKP